MLLRLGSRQGPADIFGLAPADYDVVGMVNRLVAWAASCL